MCDHGLPGQDGTPEVPLVSASLLERTKLGPQ